MRRRHRNVTEGNTSHAKRASRRQALPGTKAGFASTKSIALPYGIREPSLWGKGDHVVVDEGNLYRKTKRDNIPFIVYQICNISREVAKRPPLRCTNFYLIKIYGMMG